MALTVTATQGSGSNGMVLHVTVLTGAAKVAAQTGNSTNNQFASTTAFSQSITTTAGSNVYGAASHGSGVTDSGNNTTVIDSVDDATNGWHYSTFKALNVTGGATTRGLTISLAVSGPFAQQEILASGTLAEDASSPASVSTTSATTVTTASFTPPPGSLLVAMVGSNGGAGVTTMTVSGGGLAWTEKVKNNPSGGDYAGVWIADVPAAGGGGPAQPGQTWLRRFHHRQILPFPPPVAVGVQAGPPVYPLGHPVQARQLPQSGGRTAVRDGVYAQLGPPVRPLPGPVRARVPQPARGGQVTRRAGTYGQLGPPVRPATGPVATRSRGLPPPGRTASRDGVYAQLGPPVRPLQGPVQARRLPTRGGDISRAAGVYGQAGPPVKAPDGPVRAAQPLPMRGRAQGRAGAFTGVVITSGAPIYPLGHPVQARRLPLQGGRVVRRAGTYAQTGPPVRPLQGPVGLGRRQPPPPTRGRSASQRGPYAQTGPPVIPLRRPVRGQPQKPWLTGRGAGRAGIAVVVPPPPFQVARSTSTVADPRDGTSTVAALATSAPTVTDPRDSGQSSSYLAYYTTVYPYGPGVPPVAGSTSTSTVTDPRDGIAGVT